MSLDQQILGEIQKLAKESTLAGFGPQLAGQITRGLEGSRTSITDNAETGKWLSNLSNAGGELVTGAIDFTGGLTTGTAKISQLTGATAKALGAISPALGTLGQLGDGMVKFAEDSVDTLEGLSSSGASFNNSIVEMNYAASQTRLTLDEFAGMISKNSEQLVGLGGSVTKGAETFTRLSNDFFDRGLGDDLINMGMTFEEVNESLMNYAEVNRRTMTYDEAGRAKAAASAAAMSKEMDLIAKLTGKNRKEMEAEIQDRMRSGQVQAKLRLLEQSGNTEAAEKFRLALAEAQKAGPDAVAALEETFTKGTVVSEAGRRGLVALGEAGNNLTEVVQNINDPAADIGPTLSRFNAAIVERVNSREFLNMATLGGMGGVADAAATVLENAGPYADAVRASTEGAVDENASRQEILAAVNNMRTAAMNEQTARDGITHTLQMADARMKDTYASIGTALYNPADGIVTQISDTLTNVGQGLDDTSRATIQAFVDDLTRAFRNEGFTMAQNPSPDAATNTVTPEQQAQLQEINSSMQEVAAEQAENGQQVNEAANILNELLTGPNSVRALELLEGVSEETTAQEEALKTISENNVAFAEELRTIINEMSNATAADRASAQSGESVDQGNVDVGNNVLDSFVGSQNTQDALGDGQRNIENFTVTGTANLPTNDIMVQTVRDIQQDNATSRTEFSGAMESVNQALTPIPDRLDQVSTETRTGLNDLSDSLSTSMQSLINKMDEFIQGQNNQTRAINRTGPHIQ